MQVQAWMDGQATSWVDAELTELRVLKPAEAAAGFCFFARSCQSFLNNLKGGKDQLLCLVVDGKQKVSMSGAVIASVGILCGSPTPRNTMLDRDSSGGRLQTELRTNTVELLIRAYMDNETTDNWVRFFELLREITQKEFGHALKPRVLQVHADFSDAIEAARRPTRDYPHMMRAVTGTLSKKLRQDWQSRTLQVLRSTRFLPTAELFSAVWKVFLQELQDAGQSAIATHLKKEYIQEVSKDVLEKRLALREAPLAERTLLWGDFWAGLLCSHPGSATGTQTMEAFHSFWAKKHPTQILQSMQALYKKEWLGHMQQDDAPARPSLWPSSADRLFVSGRGLHRLGENSAEEYWDARDKGNIQKIEDEETETTFYVLRARRTDAEPSAATVSPNVAKRIVNLIKAAGTELVEAMLSAGVAEKSASGGAKLSLSSLELLFQCHCVVMRGKLAEKYYPRLYLRAHTKGKTLYSCAAIGQRAQCAHVYYVQAVVGEVDVNTLPKRKRPGRAAKRTLGASKKDSEAVKKRRTSSVRSTDRLGAFSQVS